METLRKLAVPLGRARARAAAVASLLFRGGHDRKTAGRRLPAHGLALRGLARCAILGVPVGEVETVEPSGTDVMVKMYLRREVEVPADAKAVIIAPSIVGDRFVQLTPVYDGRRGAGRRRDARLDQTATPLELDQIYEQPQRPQRRARSERRQQATARSVRPARDSTADNFDGQGANFNKTLQQPRQAHRARSTTTRRSCSAPPRSSSKFISTLAEQRPDRPQLQRVARRRRRPAGRRARGARGRR